MRRAAAKRVVSARPSAQSRRQHAGKLEKGSQETMVETEIAPFGDTLLCRTAGLIATATMIPSIDDKSGAGHAHSTCADASVAPRAINAAVVRGGEVRWHPSPARLIEHRKQQRLRACRPRSSLHKPIVLLLPPSLPSPRSRRRQRLPVTTSICGSLPPFLRAIVRPVLVR